MQKDWKLEEIKRLEKERDRNLAIHCNFVAVKYQRLINKLKKENQSKHETLLPQYSPVITRCRVFRPQSCISGLDIPQLPYILQPVIAEQLRFTGITHQQLLQPQHVFRHRRVLHHRQ